MQGILTERRAEPVKRKDGTDTYPPRWFETWEYVRGNLKPGERVGPGGSHSRFLYREASLERFALLALEKNPPKRRSGAITEQAPEHEIYPPEEA